MAAPVARTRPSPSPTAVATTNPSHGDDTSGDPHQHRLFFSWRRARNRAPFPLPICAPLPCSVRRQWQPSRDNSDRSFSDDDEARWRRYLLPQSFASLCSLWCFPSDFNGSGRNYTLRRRPFLWLP
ncbi:hypothetical protein AHAS_Ahas01G0169000 [Arachis hypogaea]